MPSTPTAPPGQRILIVRIGAMGDILHALPAVAALRQRHPDWHIGWAVDPLWADLLQTPPDLLQTPPDLLQTPHAPAHRTDRNPHIDRIIPIPTRLWRQRPLSPATLADIRSTARHLRREHFHLAVDLQGSLKSAAIGRLAGAQTLVGPANPRERAARHLYHRRVPTSAPHVVDQACEILGAAIGEPLHPAPVILPTDPASELWADQLVGTQPFLLLAPTAGWTAKEWPAERFGAVAAQLGQLGLRTLVNQHPGNQNPRNQSPRNQHPGNQNPARPETAAQTVLRASHGHTTAVPATLPQLIALTRRARLVLAGDTGPLHLAAALGRPVVGLYGPTDPSRTGPYATPSRVLRHRSSITDHHRNAPTDPGLLQITVDQVVEAIESLLAQTSIQTNPQTNPQTGAPA